MSKATQNCEMELNGNQLVITIDLDQVLGPSASGKTTLIATTRGNKSLSTIIPDGDESIYISVNCYRK